MRSRRFLENIAAAVLATLPVGVSAQTEATDLLTSNSLAHLAGYGTVGYSDRADSARGFSMVGFNPIFHFQYKDLLFFETELETALQPDGSTDVALEYANVNLFLNDYVTVFGGKFLTPVGYFFQNLHPAWINKFPTRPPGFGNEGSAAPESDVGVGARGGFRSGGMRTNYALYVGNGPRLELNEAGDEIEAIEAEGATSNPGKHPFVGGRIGFLPFSELEVGVSAGTSKVAVAEPGAPVEPTRSYNVVGADFGYRIKGFDLRGEYIQQKVGDLAASVAPAGGTWKTGYVQAAYRLPGTAWEPVVRYGKLTTPHADQALEQWGVGVDYWFAANAVAKIAYEFNKGEPGTPNDENQLLLQMAFGF